MKKRGDSLALTPHAHSTPASQIAVLRRVGSRTRSARAWLSSRHSLRTEVIVVLAFYALYEAIRGVVAGSEALAVHHAHEIVSLERSLHVFVEQEIQRGAHAVPGLIDAFGIAYLTLHLGVTGGYLLWLHQTACH